jgi:phosphatidylserine decarboxylase
MEFLRYLPRKLLSRLVGWFVHLRLPAALNQALMRWFAERYRISLDEAEFPLESYPSLGEFFTRRIRMELRPLSDSALVHPADAVVSQAGPIQEGRLLQAKGKTYDLQGLTGKMKGAEDYLGGTFLTYYLCPTDYHRVHSPVDGQILRYVHIPGDLWPVNTWSVGAIDRLFEVNERVVVEIQSSQGKCLVVFVGATNVGSISLTIVPGFKSNQGQKRIKEIIFDQPVKIDKGSELGIFHMGSTVIMVYEKSWGLNQEALAAVINQPVRVRAQLVGSLT